MHKYVALLLCVLAIAFGQVLFKQSAMTLKNSESLLSVIWDPIFWCAMALYGITTIAWIWSLQHIPLSRAYVFMALCYVIVPILDWAFFGLVLGSRQVFSTLFILTGIFIAVL